MFGDSDPNFVPTQAGQIYINITDRSVFISVGQTSVSDWIGITAPTLTTGIPAYTEPMSQTLISIDSTPFIFYLAASGTRNVYLNTINAISSNTFRYNIIGNKFIRQVIIQSSSNTTSIAEFQLRINGATTYSWNLPSGTQAVRYAVACPLTNGQEISLYLSSSKNVANPYISLDIADR